MALWAEWFPDVVPQVPGCPQPIVEHEIRRASQAFFEGTRAWQGWLDPVPVLAGEQAVAIIADDAEQEVIRLESALFDGRPLAVYPAGEMDSMFGDDWTLHTGAPSAITMDGPTTVRLYPSPSSNSVTGLKCRVSVRPSEAATGIPDEYWRRYRGHISAGAKAGLMIHAGKPWSNPEMAAMFGAAFSASIADVCIKAAKAFGRGRIPSRPTWC